MTEKRYYAHKHLLHENEVHDKRCHNFMGLDETVEHMNNEYWKYKQLKNENEQLKTELFEVRKDYILETYADNPIRRDEKLKALEKELIE